MTVSKRLRYEIMLRDNHTCRYCGATAPDVVLTIDHVIPKTLGGNDEPTNLVVACKDCNAGKSSSTATASQVAEVTADAVRWAEAMKAAAAVRAEEIGADTEVLDHFNVIWTKYWVQAKKWDGLLHRTHAPRPDDWQRSVRKFIEAGLDIPFFATAIKKCLHEVDLDRVPWDDRWRYFCGFCWRELDQRREIAHQILQGED